MSLKFDIIETIATLLVLLLNFFWAAILDFLLILGSSIN